MDLNTVTAVLTPRDLADLPPPEPGDAWLAGGTWLYSEPQPSLRRLIDLTTLGWRPLAGTADGGLSIAATCTIAELAAFASAWNRPVATLVRQCCRSLLGSFKVWNMATVGGNLCMALPAGPMISLAAALDADVVVWDRADGRAERRQKAVDFVQGPQRTSLRPGDLLRSIEIGKASLDARTAFRRISLNPLGRSGALLIGTRDPANGSLALTVTASTRRPVRIRFDRTPDAAALHAALDAAIPFDLYYDDVHGLPDWRRHVTRLFAEEIRDELGGAGVP
jgi:CO/xanthine dehydrogenase FAD-binding subunit